MEIVKVLIGFAVAIALVYFVARSIYCLVLYLLLMLKVPIGLGRILGVCAVMVPPCLLLYFPNRPDPGQSRKHKCKSNLEQLHKLLFIYSRNNNDELPSMQPKGSNQNGGVRDLYPLYTTATGNRKAILALLQPYGVQLVKFSDDPGPDEFDNQHIAYVYNSQAMLDTEDNVPVLAERGVSDGILTDDEKPVFKNGAHILMSNGSVEWVPVREGRLMIEKYDIKQEDLAKLK